MICSPFLRLDCEISLTSKGNHAVRDTIFEGLREPTLNESRIQVFPIPVSRSELTALADAFAAGRCYGNLSCNNLPPQSILQSSVRAIGGFRRKRPMTARLEGANEFRRRCKKAGRNLQSLTAYEANQPSNICLWPMICSSRFG